MRPLVDEALWTRIAPLLPKERPKPKGGRPRVSDRAALTGILFVLLTGVPWEYLPQELGCGSGMTCWRRLRDWQAQGIWEKLHRLLLRELHVADQLEWSRAAVDSSSVPAKKGAARRGRTRRIRGSRAPSGISWWTGTAPRSRSS